MAETANNPKDHAIFAGGCFWCIEAELEALDGVYGVTSGYSGGTVKNPSYKEVSSGRTDHMEAVKVEYNPEKITYTQLLDAFWGNIDPTDAGGQFFDRGNHYRTAIFYRNDAQKQQVEASKAGIEAKYGFKIATLILPETAFYAAEDYHQDFYKKDPNHYNAYKRGSRRKETLEKVWGQ